MLGLKLSIRALCLIAFATGAVDMFAGVQLLIAGGGRLASVARDPVLNSQISFWGAIWLGFGVVLWRTSARLRIDAILFRILCGITALSGLARLGAAVTYGSPGAVLTVAMVVEIGGGVALFLWHSAALRGDGEGRALQDWIVLYQYHRQAREFPALASLISGSASLLCHTSPAGMLTLKIDPRPGSDRTRIGCPSMSAIRLTMFKPRPNPGRLVRLAFGTW